MRRGNMEKARTDAKAGVPLRFQNTKELEGIWLLQRWEPQAGHRQRDQRVHRVVVREQ